MGPFKAPTQWLAGGIDQLPLMGQGAKNFAHLRNNKTDLTEGKGWIDVKKGRRGSSVQDGVEADGGDQSRDLNGVDGGNIQTPLAKTSRPLRWIFLTPIELSNDLFSMVISIVS